MQYGTYQRTASMSLLCKQVIKHHALKPLLATQHEDTHFKNMSV